MQIHPGPPFITAQFARHALVDQLADRRTDIAEKAGQNRPGAPFIHAPVAQCIEHRASNAEVAGETPAGSTISKHQIIPGVAQLAEAPSSNLDQCECKSRRGYQRNVNRTSAPGFSAKEIVRPRRMGSMPSAFRHSLEQT